MALAEAALSAVSGAPDLLPASPWGLGGAPLAPEAVRPFMTAGCAVVTFQNPQTGGRFTYRVSRAKRREGDDRPPVWFVGVLVGPDNVSDYGYIGLIDPDGRFRQTAKSVLPPTAPAIRGFAWVWSRVREGRTTAPIVVWHEGRCGRCARALTVPESIERGIGPECWARGQGA